MPYAPGVQSIGGQLIGQGLANLGQNIQGFLAGQQQRKQQLSDQAASEAKQRKSLESYLREVEPGNKDKFTTMGLPDLQGYAQSLAVKSQQKEQAKQEAQQAQAESAFQNIVNSLANPNPIAMGKGPVRPETIPVADRIMAAIGQNGAGLAAGGARNLTDIMQLMLKAQGGGADPSFFSANGPQVQDLTDQGLPGYKRVVLGPNNAQIINPEGKPISEAEKWRLDLQSLDKEIQLFDVLKTAGATPEEIADIKNRIRKAGSRGKGSASPTDPPAKPTAAPVLLPMISDGRKEAQQAIKNGKDPAAVRAKFKQLYGEDL